MQQERENEKDTELRHLLPLLLFFPLLSEAVVEKQRTICEKAFSIDGKRASERERERVRVSERKTRG